ncbi:phosphoinositide phosphatase family protein [Actinidia rufa]|uniref:Phosphoinositide phosphatase family protein n=1 Tax=Actinidia rufa TaxID=165716 RepID=A0A7J0FIR8_9ERIC|nr:phosphoinositide phosphatase family protein [Actinidia rufa]
MAGGYLKRGVNEKGRVANDVETEQIVFEDVPEGCPIPISSVVQNRGSIPLFWSQETSRLNLKPDIILSRKDQKYEATRLHFENLAKRYGNPIIILNLIKTHERKPRESILRAEFANAIEFINNDLLEENRLKFLHWDLHKHSRSKATNVLLLLGKVAAYALTLTGFFYCQVTPVLRSEGCLRLSDSENVDAGDQSPTRDCNVAIEKNGDSDGATNFEMKLCGGNSMANGNHSINPSMFQKGVLRTNCIDCLDRTNVAQYAYGLVSLGKQLRTLGVMDTSKIDLDDPLADELMWFYERMGDTLAHQYGGSAAHNKVINLMCNPSCLYSKLLNLSRVKCSIGFCGKSIP